MNSDHWHSQFARKFIEYDPIGITHKLLPEETIQEETNVDRNGGRAIDTYKHANSGSASLSDPRGSTLRMCHGPWKSHARSSRERERERSRTGSSVAGCLQLLNLVMIDVMLS